MQGTNQPTYIQISYNFFAGLPHVVDQKRVKKMILYNHVPINYCCTMIGGLPYTWKTMVLDKLFEGCIQGHVKIDESKSLKVHNVCAFGAYPFKEFTWSHTSKIYSAVYLILSDLIQTYALRNIPFNEIIMTESSAQQMSSKFGDDLLDNHFEFLYKKCHQHLEMIKPNKSSLAHYQSGLSLANGLDIGVSKAVYDILPLFALCFKKLICLVFFSLSRDIESMDKLPDLSSRKYENLPEQHQVMKNYPRLSYILRFALYGYHTKTQQDSSHSVLVAIQNGEGDYEKGFKALQDKFMEEVRRIGVEESVLEWICVNPNDKSSIKLLQKKIETIISHKNHLHITVPLKWFFLQSLIAKITDKSQTPTRVVLLPFKRICSLAKKLDMNEEDVRLFLTTFTDFASLLYCPLYRPLSDYVITDIEAFVKLLDTLYHPQPEQDDNDLIKKYGIVLQTSAKKILCDIWQIVMSILVSLGLAAKLAEDQFEIQDLPESVTNQTSYFMPNVRVGNRDEDVLSSSMFFYMEEEEKNGNRAALSQSIISRHPPSKIKLIPSEAVNCTKLKVVIDSSVNFEIHIVYHGKMFEFRLVGLPEGAPPDSSPIISACTTIVEGCSKGLAHESNFKKGIDFTIKFMCLANKDLIKYPCICSCPTCQNGKHPYEVLWWKKALENVRYFCKSKKNLIMVLTSFFTLQCKEPLSYEHLQQRQEGNS